MIILISANESIKFFIFITKVFTYPTVLIEHAGIINETINIRDMLVEGSPLPQSFWDNNSNLAYIKNPNKSNGPTTIDEYNGF